MTDNSGTPWPKASVAKPARREWAAKAAASWPAASARLFTTSATAAQERPIPDVDPAVAELGHHGGDQLGPGGGLLAAIGAVRPLDAAPGRPDLRGVGRRGQVSGPMEGAQGVQAPLQGRRGQLPWSVR